MVDQQCKMKERGSVEGLTIIDSFESCVDDPNWYTEDNKGKKHYCKDIGISANCYNFDPKQQEGWERCLKTCGNCAKTKVTTLPQDIKGLAYDESGEQYGKAGKVDDSRKFFGKGIGDKKSIDIRSTITKSESEDIDDITDRLDIVEDLYDMLLGSVNSCVDCKKYTSQPSCDSKSACKWDSNGTGACNTKIPSTTDGKNRFRSCNGSELSCEYTIKKHKSKSTKDKKGPSANPSTSTKQVSGDKVSHTYVKHSCNDDGDCSLMFPTYDFRCDQLPKPQSLTEKYNRIIYRPISLSSRKCLSDDYIKTNNITDKKHTCSRKSNVILKEPKPANSNDNNTIKYDNNKFKNGSVTISGSDKNKCKNYKNTKITKLDSTNKIFQIFNNNDNISSDIIDNKCTITQQINESIPKCHTVDSTNNKDINSLCASTCNKFNKDTRFIATNNNECYCFKDNPAFTKTNVIPENKKDKKCPTNTLELLNQNKLIRSENIKLANVNPNEEIQNMCKSYFLLDKSLTGEDMDSAKKSSSNKKITGTTGRISLYDMCPKQCKAPGCN